HPRAHGGPGPAAPAGPAAAPQRRGRAPPARGRVAELRRSPHPRRDRDPTAWALAAVQWRPPPEAARESALRGPLALRPAAARRRGATRAGDDLGGARRARLSPALHEMGRAN